MVNASGLGLVTLSFATRVVSKTVTSVMFRFERVTSSGSMVDIDAQPIDSTRIDPGNKGRPTGRRWRRPRVFIEE